MVLKHNSFHWADLIQNSIWTEIRINYVLKTMNIIRLSHRWNPRDENSKWGLKRNPPNDLSVNYSKGCLRAKLCQHNWIWKWTPWQKSKMWFKMHQNDPSGNKPHLIKFKDLSPNRVLQSRYSKTGSPTSNFCKLKWKNKTDSKTIMLGSDPPPPPHRQIPIKSPPVLTGTCLPLCLCVIRIFKSPLSCSAFVMVTRIYG